MCLRACARLELKLVAIHQKEKPMFEGMGFDGESICVKIILHEIYLHIEPIGEFYHKYIVGPGIDKLAEGAAEIKLAFFLGIAPALSPYEI